MVKDNMSDGPGYVALGQNNIFSLKYCFNRGRLSGDCVSWSDSFKLGTADTQWPLIQVCYKLGLELQKTLKKIFFPCSWLFKLSRNRIFCETTSSFSETNQQGQGNVTSGGGGSKINTNQKKPCVHWCTCHYYQLFLHFLLCFAVKWFIMCFSTVKVV